MLRTSRLVSLTVTVCLAHLALENRSLAQTTYTYSTSSNSNSWLTATNWTVGGSTATKFPGVTANGGLTNGSNTDVAAIGNFTFSGGLGINFNSASGSLSLGTISYTAGTDLQIGNSQTTTAGTLTLTGSTVSGSGSFTNTVIYSNSSNNLTIANANSGSGSGNQTMAVSLSSATDNKVVLDGSGNVTLASVIQSSSGTTPLTITGGGSGVATLSGTNTFTGAVSVLGAELRIASDASLGNSANSVTVNGGIFGNVSGTNLTINSGRSLFVGDQGGSIAANGTSKVTYNGTIANVTGTLGAFNKIGAGTLSLGGANTFSGGVTVNGGTLLVTNSTTTTSSSGAGTGAVTVNSGAAIASGSTGGVGGNLTINSGGTLDPGGTGIGTLTVAKSLFLNGGATWTVDLDLSNSANLSKVAVNTTLNLAGASSTNQITLNLVNVGTFQTGTNTYNFATYGSINSFASNKFAVSASGFVITSYSISASGGVVSINFTADVPEPSTVLLLCAGAFALYRTIRRRRNVADAQYLTV